MNDTEFHQDQLRQFATFSELLRRCADADDGAPLKELARQFAELNEEPERLLDDAPELVARMLTTAPQFAEQFPRDLLWYLGGECLHFMPDEEIEQFSALDEQRREAEAAGGEFNWRAAQASARGLQ